MKRFFKNKKGFTLIELIVVIAILGILSAVAIPKLTGFQDTAKKNADKASFAALNNAVNVGVANSNLTDGSITATANATTGIVTFTDDGTSTNASKMSGLISGSIVFQHSTHLGDSWTWTISGGAITGTAPTLD